jgi:glycosyltransferase involved in cell wall biosynthesis
MGVAAAVSVIIPCYRASGTVERALRSVLCQTHQPAEIILIDDRSQDGTLDCLLKLAREIGGGRIRVLALDKNLGPGGARNAGWNVATQPFVAFLDSDDAWHPRKLELQMRCALMHQDVWLLGSEVAVLVSESASPPEIDESRPPEFIDPALVLLSNPFSTPSVIVRRDVPYRFDDCKRYSEDYLLWAQLILSGKRACIIRAPLTFLFKSKYGEGGLSAHLWRMEKGELDTYAQLRKSKLINTTQMVGCSALSLLKFARRLLVVFARNFSTRRFVPRHRL